MEKNIKFEQNTPLWDNSLSLEERLDYLTGALTLEKKNTLSYNRMSGHSTSWNPCNLYGRRGCARN